MNHRRMMPGNRSGRFAALRNCLAGTALAAAAIGAMLCTGQTPVSAQTYAGKIGVEADCRGAGPFVDLVKTIRPWGVIGGSTNTPVDSNGWPTTDAEAVLMDDRPLPAWAPPLDDPAGFQPAESGVYNCSFTGQATLAINGGSVATIANQSYNSGTNTTTFTLTLPSGTWQTAPNLLVVDFSATKRTSGSATNTGFTNFKAIRPGYPANSTQVFTDPFVAAFGPFAHVRYMGWKDTNYAAGYYGDAGHHLINWSDRGLPSDASQATNQTFRAGAIGMAWEYIILLANQINKDVWINIPVTATGYNTTDTTSYIYQLALLFKNGDAATGGVGLKPGLHIYIEHSNEVWNFGFSQYTWNKLEAVDAVAGTGSLGTTHVNSDGSTDQEVWAHRRHAERLYQIAQIFKTVFGAGSLNTTIRPVYASWVINPQSYYTDVLNWMNTQYGAPSGYFYSIAGTSYFNNTPTAGQSVASILASMQTNSDSNLTYTQQLRTVANNFGLKLFSYEGGPDNGGGDTTNVGNRILANRDPGMTAVIEHDVRTNYFTAGGADSYNYFTMSSGFSRYGCWGASEDITQIGNNMPKWAAIYNLTGYVLGGPPSAPTSLTASAGNAQVVLNWTASSGATSYNALRSTVSGSGYASVATGIAGTTYTNTGLTNGTTYYFVVTATNANGTSGNSNQASATPISGVPPVPTGLTAAAGNAQVVLNWNVSSGATAYDVKRSTVSGSGYVTVSSPATNSYTNTGLTNGTTYYFVVAAKNASGSSANSSQVSATPTAGTLPAPWVDTDIGAPGVAGSGSYASPTFTVKGSGADIWGASDQLNMVNQGVTGDCTVIARVASVTNTNAWSKVGVMIRETTGATSAFADMLITPSNGANFQYRATTGGNAAGATTTGIVAPYWVKLVRAGNNISGYMSSNGSTWVQVGTTQAITMAAGVKIGLCVTAHDNTQLCTATFDNVSVTGTTIPAAPTNLTATPGNGQVVLNWTASAGATSYTVNFTTGGNYTVAGNPATNTFTHTGLTNGTQYTYFVTATNSAGTSGASNNASATPTAGGSGTQYVTEPFGEATGKLDAAAGGTGWGAGWFTQNNDATVPGYNVATGGLTYTGLTTTGNKGVGGNAFLTAGRALDVSAGGPFGTNGYLTGGNIGASGKTLWMSFLIRKDVSNQQTNEVVLHANAISWNDSPVLFGAGYFGAASETGGTKFWSLDVNGTIIKSNVALTVGTTALLVVRVDFGATNTFTMYVNPTSLGGSAPGTSNASGTTTTAMAFKSLAYYAGDSAGASSLDEIKMGDTYAAVTR